MLQFQETNVNKEEAEKILKYKDLNNRNTLHVACKHKSDTTDSHKRKMTNAHILLTPLYEHYVTVTCSCCTA